MRIIIGALLVLGCNSLDDWSLVQKKATAFSVRNEFTDTVCDFSSVDAMHKCYAKSKSGKWIDFYCFDKQAECK